ncbi:hypothetical protein [Nocardioides sp.]|uniref:hypothetical protein n=1 Tax=Nocardioides sp. TaxID=35761 RepID=UPI002B8114FB|nr:hypothetical protein [Nocardioides sp.]HSX68949.1 hypothetical protein [Nocardioides sp.]
MTWLDQHWGLVLLGSGLLGILATLVGLRLWASRVGADMEAEVRDGSLLWGAQVQQRGEGRRSSGARGRLLLLSDGTLTFVPFPSDQKRGATSATWALDQVLVTFVGRRRDITGLAVQLLRVDVADQPCREFAAAMEVGARPAQWNR